jgi:archaellum component FlaF (FlaF/FlaG flagellin family)
MKDVNLFRIALGLVALTFVATHVPTVGASPSLAMPAGDFLSGCTGEYFNNTTLSGSPVFVRTDPAVNFFWREWTSPAPGINVDNYSVRWTCTINVPTAGTYTFTIVADDGMNLLVDSTLLIWAWYDQGPSSYSNPIYLYAGTHTVRVEYYNHTLGGTAQVYSNIGGTGIYSPPSGTGVYYPPSGTGVYYPPSGTGVYYPPSGTGIYYPPSGTGVYYPPSTTYGLLSNCTGEYFNNITLSGSPALVRTDPGINFFWREWTSPGPGINTSYYSVRWTCSVNVATAGTYTFTILTDDGMNLLVDGTLLIWAWYDQGPSSYSNSLYLSAGTHTIRVEGVDLRFGHRTTAMRNYVNLAVPTMPLLVADKRGAAETKIIARVEYYNRTLGGTAQVSMR